MTFRTVLSAVVLAASLAACSMFPLGPDLTKSPSPFGDAPTIRFGGDGGQVTEIHHSDAGDTAVLDFSDPGGPRNKSFDAGITWIPVANPGDSSHDYWLAGINIFRTADRSAYLLMRYPRGLKIARPMKSDAFETMMITCHMRGVEPFGFRASDETDSSGGTSASSSSSDGKVCDFADRGDLDAFLPQVLDKAKNAAASSSDDDDDYKWQPVTIELP